MRDPAERLVVGLDEEVERRARGAPIAGDDERPAASGQPVDRRKRERRSIARLPRAPSAARAWPRRDRRARAPALLDARDAAPSTDGSMRAEERRRVDAHPRRSARRPARARRSRAAFRSASVAFSSCVERAEDDALVHPEHVDARRGRRRSTRPPSRHGLRRERAEQDQELADEAVQARAARPTTSVTIRKSAAKTGIDASRGRRSRRSGACGGARRSCRPGGRARRSRGRG